MTKLDRLDQELQAMFDQRDRAMTAIDKSQSFLSDEQLASLRKTITKQLLNKQQCLFSRLRVINF